MELILAVMIGFFCLFKHAGKQRANKHHEEQKKRRDVVASSISVSAKTSQKVKESLSVQALREKCFDEVDSYMRLILGENWKIRFFNNQMSEWVFQNHLGEQDFGYQLIYLENIVYYLILAKSGQAPPNFSLHKITGFSEEESYDIIKKTCVVIERILKQRFPGLSHDLDMFVCEIGEHKSVEFRYRVDYLQISNARKLEIEA